MKKFKQLKQSAFFILFLLAIFSCSKDNELENSNINAQKNYVELSQAKEIASEIFFETKNNSFKSKGIAVKSSIKTIETINEAKNDKGKTSFYIINYNEGGFLLLSADKRTEPILGFSENGKFDIDENSYPPGLKIWVKDAKKQITEIQNSNIEQSEKDKLAWKQVQYLIASSNLFAKEPPIECYDHTETITVGPLLSTVWEQEGGFNDALSYKNCDGINRQVLAGCVPIAMAQVMKYYQYPTNYSWSSMPLTTGTTTTANLIADIHNAIHNEYSDNPKYKCDEYGVATNVDSNKDMAIVLKTQFNYSYASKASYDYNTVKNNLDNNKPVILNGNDGGPEGHMWVCDGYRQLFFYSADCTGGSFYPTFHMNWGWSDGHYNGYFAYNNFNPYIYNFNINTKMIYNIIP